MTHSVFLLQTPLVGLEKLGDVLQGGYPAALRHVGVLVASPRRTLLLDWLPAEPTAPRTALLLLSGNSVPAVLRSRALRAGAAPHERWHRALPLGLVRPELAGAGLLGESEADAELDAALRGWHDSCGDRWARVRLRDRNCRTYARELCSFLTGSQVVL